MEKSVGMFRDTDSNRRGTTDSDGTDRSTKND